MRLFAFALALVPVANLAAPSVPAQESLDFDAVTRIRAEGMDRSQVMDTLWWLTDRYGPRLTNSPQERRALQWAKERLEGYGLANAALADSPALVNEDAQGKAWFFKVRMTDLKQLDGLMDAAAYADYVKTL